MPKLLVRLLAAYSLAPLGQTPQAVSMPPGKTEATFKDPRVVSFLKTVTDGFNVSCTPSDPANTKAMLTLPKPITASDALPDAAGFASTWYEVAVSCSGVTTVTIKAEFTPLSGDKPLNLVLSLKQVLNR